MSCKINTCSRQLLSRFFATHHYLSTHHDALPLPRTENVPDELQENEEAYLVPSMNTASNSTKTIAPVPPVDCLPPGQVPDAPEAFIAAQRQLAQDLVITAKQLEETIFLLPGADQDRTAQECRITALDEELQAALERRAQAEERRQSSLQQLENIIINVRRYGVESLP